MFTRRQGIVAAVTGAAVGGVAQTSRADSPMPAVSDELTILCGVMIQRSAISSARYDRSYDKSRWHLQVTVGGRDVYCRDEEEMRRFMHWFTRGTFTIDQENTMKARMATTSPL